MAGHSPSRRWQARTWQDSRSVTGVTERVLRSGDFTPFLQLANLICAIAPVGRGHRRTIRTHPARPPRPVRNSPEQTRPSPHADPSGPDRTRGFRSPCRTARRPGVRGRTRAQRSRWTRRSPARSNDAPVRHRYGARWGGRPSCGAMGGPVQVGGPGSPVVAARQGCVRPRCAAAEYPQAVRGPLPRGTGDVHRACGWT